MNIKSAVFGFVCIKSQTINNVVKKLPYKPSSIYNAIEEMLRDGKIMKIKTHGEIQLDVSKDYKNQKFKEFFIKSLSYGIDPEILLRENTQAVWKSLDDFDNIKDLTNKINLSEKTARRILSLFSEYGLVKFEKKKPIIVKKAPDHPINILLEYLSNKTETSSRIYTPGSTPFEEIISTPDEIEKILYDKIDESLTIKRTGFLIKGKNKKISVLESIPTKQTLEEFFIHKLMTPEGVEDTCIKILAYADINYDALLHLAIKQDIVNLIGCYLDIVKGLKKEIVPDKAIKKFKTNISNKKSVFLKVEMKYGKSGWEKNFEKKWNVDLYLDIGAIEHGVRAT